MPSIAQQISTAQQRKEAVKNTASQVASQVTPEEVAEKDRIGYFPDSGFFAETGLTSGSLQFTQPKDAQPIPDHNAPPFNPNILAPDLFTKTAENVKEGIELGAEAVGGIVEAVLTKAEAPKPPKTEEIQIQEVNFNYTQQSYGEQKNDSLKEEQKAAVKEAERILGEFAGITEEERNRVTGKQLNSKTANSPYELHQVRTAMLEQREEVEEQPEAVSNQVSGPAIYDKLNTTGEQVGQTYTTLVG